MNRLGTSTTNLAPKKIWNVSTNLNSKTKWILPLFTSWSRPNEFLHRRVVHVKFWFFFKLALDPIFISTKERFAILWVSFLRIVAFVKMCVASFPASLLAVLGRYFFVSTYSIVLEHCGTCELRHIWMSTPLQSKQHYSHYNHQVAKLKTCQTRNLWQPVPLTRTAVHSPTGHRP